MWNARWVGFVTAMLGFCLGCGDDATGVSDAGLPDGGVDTFADAGGVDGAMRMDATGVDGSAGDTGNTDTGNAGCAMDLLPAWVEAAAPTAEVYVATDGDDDADGSAAAPLRTARAAFRRLGPGVRVNFAAGTYACDGAVVSDMLAPTDNPAVIRSADGPREAKFDCAGGGGIMMVLVRGLIIDGIEVSNTSGHGVQVSSGSPFDTANLSSDIVVRRSFIHDTGLACYKASQARSLGIYESECQRANPGRQMFEFVAVDDVTLAYNEGSESGPFNEIKGGAKGGRIVGNYVHDTAAGILVGADCTGFEFLIDESVNFEARDLEVYNNVMVNIDDAAFRIVSCHDCLVANNTYWAPEGGSAIRMINSGFAIGGDCNAMPTENRNITIVNNIFAAGSAYRYMIPSNAAEVPGLDMTHNLWFGGGSDVEATGSDIPFAGEAQSVYSLDPLLVIDGSRVTLGAGSPAIGAGREVSAVRATAAGVCSPSPPNLGAF